MDRISLVLVILGAINWLLIGLFGYDVVSAIFGSQAALGSKIVYVLIGLGGLWSISLLFRQREFERHEEA